MTFFWLINSTNLHTWVAAKLGEGCRGGGEGRGVLKSENWDFLSPFFAENTVRHLLLEKAKMSQTRIFKLNFLRSRCDVQQFFLR
jgi:hypothetical protein